MVRKLALLAGFAGALLTLAACADSPTLPDQRERIEELASGRGRVLDQQPQGCVIEGYCVLPPISGGGSTCDPHLELDWSCDGDGDCLTSAGNPADPEGVLVVQGCPRTGGGGGGGSYPSPPDDPDPICPTVATSACPSEPPPPDTCWTNDPVVDDADVWGQFQSLWTESVLKGTERGGWVTRDGTNSYRLIPFQNAVYGPCGIDVYERAPAGTVSIVHTHPWPLFQVNPCGYINTGTPSLQDQQALQTTGLSTGYFLDANGIGRFTATGGQQATRIGRCGY